MSTAAPITSASPVTAVPAFASAPGAASTSDFVERVAAAAAPEAIEEGTSGGTAAGGYRPGPLPGADTEITTFGRVSFSGAAGSVLIALQVERSAAEGATSLEADHGFAAYRFAQALSPEPQGADTVTVETPGMADAAADEIPLAA